MRIIIENADKNDFNELAKLARAGKINTFCMTDDERPQGKWVKCQDGYTRCDQCGSRCSAIKARFCHHCGADMRTKENQNG